MSITAQSPIGIFDSGIGGLTVAHAIQEVLPHEPFIYFGDTAHMPYGDKSQVTIQSYALKITNVLLDQGCKVILIACNSASAASYELVKEYVGSRAHVMNVIDPVVDYASEHYAGQRVGLIGTKQTINSGVFAAKLAAKAQGLELRAEATPLLAPMIEEGFFNKAISHDIIQEYLNSPTLQGLEGLILGCTHYPLIKDQVKEIMGPSVDMLDTAQIVAHALKEFLTEQGLLHAEPRPPHRFLVSDYTESFAASAQMFFHEPLKLEKFPLWE